MTLLKLNPSPNFPAPSTPSQLSHTIARATLQTYHYYTWRITSTPRPYPVNDESNRVLDFTDTHYNGLVHETGQHLPQWHIRTYPPVSETDLADRPDTFTDTEIRQNSLHLLQRNTLAHRHFPFTTLLSQVPYACASENETVEYELRKDGTDTQRA
jgi:hypothetical protein